MPLLGPLGFFRANPRLLMAGAAVIALLGLIAWERHKGAEAVRAELKVAEANLATCQGNRKALEASLDAQNEAVAALGRESEARVAESRKQAQAAEKSALARQARASVILKASRGGLDACSAADRLILQEAGR